VPSVVSSNIGDLETLGNTMVDDDRILSKRGVRFFPISMAANLGQVPRTTLLDWIKAEEKFQGELLETYNSSTTRRLYLTEESVRRLANRFVRWGSNEPAGRVTLGKGVDGTGYIRLQEAARAVGVDHHTMWLWVTQNKAPTGRPLDVVKCPISDHLYIRQRDVSELQAVVPRAGLRLGRRPQVEPRP
jgi:hypothetical protein